MKKIEWELPFESMHYLESLTNDLAGNPYVQLITGVQDEAGNIRKCNIFLKEDRKDMDSIILLIGAAIGAHSVTYATRMAEIEEAMTEFFDVMNTAIDDFKSRGRCEVKGCDIEGEHIHFESNKECGVEGCTIKGPHTHTKEELVKDTTNEPDLFKETEKQEKNNEEIPLMTKEEEIDAKSVIKKTEKTEEQKSKVESKTKTAKKEKVVKVIPLKEKQKADKILKESEAEAVETVEVIETPFRRMLRIILIRFKK